MQRTLLPALGLAAALLSTALSARLAARTVRT